MTYDFFANKEDKIDVLEFIFKETDLRVYDLSSHYGQEICEYKTVEEILAKHAPSIRICSLKEQNRAPFDVICYHVGMEYKDF
jgi:hypothetical protein